MELFIMIIAILLVFAFFCFRLGSAKYQVEHYIKKYARLLSEGSSKEQAVNTLMNFYLRAEPSWKKGYMIKRHADYIENFDDFLWDINFNFKYNPDFLILDPPKEGVADMIFEKINSYMKIYKEKYGI